MERQKQALLFAQKTGYGQDDTALWRIEGRAIPGPNHRDLGHPTPVVRPARLVFGNGQWRSGAVSLWLIWTERNFV
jgi:hypothetical protein